MTKNERSQMMKFMWQNSEYRKHMSEAHKGQHSSPTTQFKKGQSPWNKDIKYFKIKGNKHYNWKGGKVTDKRGYVFIKRYNHPYSHNDYVPEHRITIEKILKRYLKPVEEVHHLKKKNDNHPQNLMVFINHSAHQRFERNGKIKPEEIIFDGRAYH